MAGANNNERETPDIIIVPAEYQMTRMKSLQLNQYDLIDHNIIVPGMSDAGVKLMKEAMSMYYPTENLCDCRVPKNGGERCWRLCKNFQRDTECGSECVSDKFSCWNRSITNGLHKRVKIVARPDIWGFGLFAGEDIKTWEHIVAYYGLLVREWDNKHLGASHYAATLVDAGKRDDFRNIKKLTDAQKIKMTKLSVVLEAAEVGNVGRYVNHSHVPNCKARIVKVGDRLEFSIMAKRLIKAGEELTFDYGADYQGLGIDVCKCPAKKCREKTEEQEPSVIPVGPSIAPSSPATVYGSSDDDLMKDVPAILPKKVMKTKNVKKKTSAQSAVDAPQANTRITRARAKNAGPSQDTVESIQTVNSLPQPCPRPSTSSATRPHPRVPGPSSASSSSRPHPQVPGSSSSSASTRPQQQQTKKTVPCKPGVTKNRKESFSSTDEEAPPKKRITVEMLTDILDKVIDAAQPKPSTAPPIIPTAAVKKPSIVTSKKFAKKGGNQQSCSSTKWTPPPNNWSLPTPADGPPAIRKLFPCYVCEAIFQTLREAYDHIPVHLTPQASPAGNSSGGPSQNRKQKGDKGKKVVPPKPKCVKNGKENQFVQLQQTESMETITTSEDSDDDVIME